MIRMLSKSVERLVEEIGDEQKLAAIKAIKI